MANKKSLIEKLSSSQGEARWTTIGWGLLLLGGLAHMLPVQMAQLLRWSLYGVSVQMAVGAISVVLAIYFLLGNE